MRKRKYTMKRRAERQSETRARIVEATMALHEELGAGRTTVSAIAERAGVQRLTVYRHFPDDSALLQACTSRWLELNPPPDPAGWQDAGDPPTRTRRAIGALCAYYRSTEEMWRKAYRDVDEVPALAVQMRGFEECLDGIRADLVASWTPAPTRRARLHAILGHALRFSTWHSLALEGLEDGAMADLLAAWVETVVRHRASPGCVHAERKKMK
jgi:AcrR family transcriptional regulator